MDTYINNLSPEDIKKAALALISTMTPEQIFEAVCNIEDELMKAEARIKELENQNYDLSAAIESYWEDAVGEDL